MSFPGEASNQGLLDSHAGKCTLGSAPHSPKTDADTLVTGASWYWWGAAPPRKPVTGVKRTSYSMEVQAQ